MGPGPKITTVCGGGGDTRYRLPHYSMDHIPHSLFPSTRGFILQRSKRKALWGVFAWNHGETLFVSQNQTHKRELADLRSSVIQGKSERNSPHWHWEVHARATLTSTSMIYRPNPPADGEVGCLWIGCVRNGMCIKKLVCLYLMRLLESHIKTN